MFSIYVSDKSQALKCDFSLYANDSRLVSQHKDINKIEKCNICDCFVDNKLSIHFGYDDAKSINFASKFQRKNKKKNNVTYWNIQIKDVPRMLTQ